MKKGEGKKKKFFLCAVFIAASVFAVPSFSHATEKSAVAVKQQEKVFTIEDCIDFALKHDPNIKVYENTQMVQKNAVGIAKSNYFPTLGGSTGYNLNNTRYSGDLSGSDNNNYYQVNVSVNQLIWDFGKTAAKINMNKFNYLAAGFDLENAILGTVYNVKTAYASLLASMANLDIYQRSVNINRLNVERTTALYREGLKSKIDVVNAEVNLTEARVELLNAQTSYQTDLIALNKAMCYINAPIYSIKNPEGFNFQKRIADKNELDIAYRKTEEEARVQDGAFLTSGIQKDDIIQDYKFKPYDISMDDSIKKSYDNRPDLKSLSLVKKASEESLKAIKRIYMPNLGASAGYSFQKATDIGTSGVNASLGLTLPTINAMSIKCQIDQGKAYLEIASSNIDLLKKNIYFEVQNYYTNMKQLEKKIPLMSKKVEETLENFELADGRYTVGLGNYIELQQAHLNYNNAQLAFVQAVFDYNVARFYLEKSMGVR